MLTTRDYGYNERDQLTSITDTDGLDITYDYDAFGNQTEKTENGILTTFDYTPRQRVKSITTDSGQPNQYEYDYAGQRVNAISASGTERRYLYDGLTLIAETNTIGNTLATYHYGTRNQLAETRNSQNAFYLTDALGTTVAITNQDGSIQNRMDYDVWGNLNQESATSASPFGFTGYIKDEETDLYYANARYYDSFTGRFLREDPLNGEVNTPPSLHRYLYGYANPTYYVDPDGRYAEAGHEKTVKIVSEGIGFDAEIVTALGVFAQLPDEVDEYDAVELTKNWWLFGEPHNSRAIRRLPALHALMHDPESLIYSPYLNGEGAMAEIELNRTVRAIMSIKDNKLAVGILLHRFGDLFSHRRLGEEVRVYGTNTGHGGHGTTPDVIQKRPELYDNYVQSLISVLAQVKGDIPREEFEVLAKNILAKTDRIKNIPTRYPAKGFAYKRPTFDEYGKNGFNYLDFPMTKSNGQLQKESNQVANQILEEANKIRLSRGEMQLNLYYKPENQNISHIWGADKTIQDVLDYAYESGAEDPNTVWQLMYFEPQVRQAVDDAINALEATPALPLEDAIKANQELIIFENRNNELGIKNQ